MKRPGSVLVATLLGLLLLNVIALGGLAVARDALGASTIRTLALQARLQAESAAAAVLADWTALGLDTLAEGRIVRHEVGEGSAEIERAGSGFIVRGYAPAAGDRPRARMRVFSLSPDSLAGLPDAALHVAGPVRLEAGALLDGSGMVCTDGSSPRPGLIAPPDAVASAPGATLVGTPPQVTQEPAPARIDGLPILRIARLADVRVEGLVTPAPQAAAGLCVGADDNWGDPDGGPCAERVPVIAATADLTVAGGRGQGVLIVPGTLRMIGGARFEGIVFAGAIDIGDADIRGAVRTLAADTSTLAGSIRFDGCALSRALRARALRRPFSRGRLRLPTP